MNSAEASNVQVNAPGRVRLMSSADAAKWDEFVRRHPEGTFFHLSAWQDVIGAYLKHPTYYFCLERDGEIAGVLPLARVKSWLFGDALLSLPFLVYGGPLGSDSQAVEQLLRSATSLAEELGVDYLELRNRKPVTDWPTKSSYVTFRKAIEPDVEKNLLAIPRKQRAVVRKAIKAGLAAEIDSGTERLYSILSECKRNLGTPFFSRGYLDSIVRAFPEDCQVLTVTHDAEVLSSVMSFTFKNEILPYYGGGGRAARRFGANDFMYWKVMEKACQEGKEIFDFGRSQAGTGPYNFKRYWGFEPETLSYEFYLVKAKEVPRLDPSNSRYGKAIQLWSKLPLPVSRTIGPRIARLLG